MIDVQKEDERPDNDKFANEWWKLGRPRYEMRDAIKELPQFTATPMTAKHRFFVNLKASILADQGLVVLAINSFSKLAGLSSRLHVFWSMKTGGWMGVEMIHVIITPKPSTLSPFPACITDKSNTTLTTRLSELGERLDAFRKERLGEHDFLTMTAMYNVLERLRELDNGCDVPPLTDTERDIHEAGLISVLKDIHDEIDLATFEAYGWDDLAEILVGRPGATMPSPHKTKQQEEAEEELLTRLVALNLERQEEEKRGQVRWLRPEYQIPKLGHKVPQADLGKALDMDVNVIAAADKPKWPKDGLDQIRIVRDVLTKTSALALPVEISANFAGKNTASRKSRIEAVLQTLVETGAARTGELEGSTRYFIPK